MEGWHELLKPVAPPPKADERTGFRLSSGAGHSLGKALPCRSFLGSMRDGSLSGQMDHLSHTLTFIPVQPELSSLQRMRAGQTGLLQGIHCGNQSLSRTTRQLALSR